MPGCRWRTAATAGMPGCSSATAERVVPVLMPLSVVDPEVMAVSAGTPVCSHCWAMRASVVPVAPVWVPGTAATAARVVARASYRCGVPAVPAAPVVSVPVVATAVSAATAGCGSAMAAPVVRAAAHRGWADSAATAVVAATPGHCRSRGSVAPVGPAVLVRRARSVSTELVRAIRVPTAVMVVTAVPEVWCSAAVGLVAPADSVGPVARVASGSPVLMVLMPGMPATTVAMVVPAVWAVPVVTPVMGVLAVRCCSVSRVWPVSVVPAVPAVARVLPAVVARVWLVTRPSWTAGPVVAVAMRALRVLVARVAGRVVAVPMVQPVRPGLGRLQVVTVVQAVPASLRPPRVLMAARVARAATRARSAMAAPVVLAVAA